MSRNSKVIITVPWEENSGQACLARFLHRDKLKNLNDDKWGTTRKKSWLKETNKLVQELKDDFLNNFTKFYDIRIVIFENKNIILKTLIKEKTCYLIKNEKYELLNCPLKYLIKINNKTSKDYKFCNNCMKLYRKKCNCQILYYK